MKKTMNDVLTDIFQNWSATPGSWSGLQTQDPDSKYGFESNSFIEH